MTFGRRHQIYLRKLESKDFQFPPQACTMWLGAAEKVTECLHLKHTLLVVLSWEASFFELSMFIFKNFFFFCFKPCYP